MDSTKITKRNESVIGKYYERHLFALISLKCLLNSNIKDFWISSNITEIEKFDDVVLHLEYQDGAKEIFLVQIKHKKNRDKPVVADMFCTKDKDYSLQMYQDAYNKIIKDTKILKLIEAEEDITIYFIILNNCKINVDNGNDKLEFKKKKPKFLEFLGSKNYDDSSCYQITNKTENFNDLFLRKFYFNPEQYEIEDIENQIKEVLKVDSIITEIIHFFYQYTEKKENDPKISKLQIKMKVLSSIFGHFTVPVVNPVDLSLTKTIKKFHVTLISDEKSESILWSEIIFLMQDFYNVDFPKWDDNCLLDEIQERIKLSFSSLPNETLTPKILYFYMVALSIVPFFKATTIRSSDINIYELLSKLEVFSVINDSEGDSQTTHLEKIKLFRTMDDLDEESFKENAKTIYISFEKKSKPSLDSLEIEKKSKLSLDSLEIERDVRKQITSNHFIQLKNTTVSITHHLDIFSELYINRRLQQPIFEQDFLCNNNFLVIICKMPSVIQKSFDDRYSNVSCGIFQKYYAFDSELDTNIDPEDYEEFENLCNLWITKDSYNSNILKEINNLTAANFYVLQYERISDQEKIILVYAKGPLENLRTHVHYEIIQDYELAIKNKISRVNIISNIAGMGKSRLLRYLFQISPKDEWLLYFESSKYMHRLGEIQNFEEFIDFLFKSGLAGTVSSGFQSAFEAFFKSYIRNGKLILLIDDFEEVKNKKLLDIFNEATQKGVTLWIVTRPSIKDSCEKYFGTLSMELVEFSEKDQDKFYRNFFKKNKRDNIQIKTILGRVKRIIKKLEISFISICQQTIMLAEILLLDPEIQQVETHDLYEKFIKQTIKKYYSQNQDFILNTISKLALTIFFKKTILSQIFDWTEFEYDIEVFKNVNTKNPFIEFTKEGIVFSHKTYAEFLAARWLAINTRKQIFNETPFNIKPLIKHLYYRELTNVRWFFDNIILTMETKKHVVDICSSKIVFTTDILGRNICHFSMTYGKQFVTCTNSQIEEVFCKEEPAYVKYTDNEILLQVPEVVNGNKSYEFPNISYYNKLTIISENTWPLSSPTENHVISSQDEDLVMKVRLCKRITNLMETTPFNVADLLSLYTDHFLNLSPLKCALLSGCLNEINKTMINNLDDFYMETFSKLDSEYCYFLLYHAVKNGFNNILEKLMKQENLKNKILLVRDSTTKMSLLHLAVKHHREGCIDLLLTRYLHGEFGQDINGNSPIHLACDWRNVNIVQKFFCGINPVYLSLKNNKGESPLYCYTQHNNLECVKLLVSYLNKSNIDDPEYDTGNSPFILSFLKKKLKIAKVLYKGGADINFANHRGNTALHFCAFKGSTLFAEKLIEWKAKIDCRNKIGLSPLILAAREGRTKLVELLLKNNADVNYCDKNNWTALHHAVKRKKTNVVETLLTMKADINFKNSKGNTPLIIACTENLPKIVEMLLNNNAKVDQYSISALSICEEKRHEECANKIRTYLKDKQLSHSMKKASKVFLEKQASKPITVPITKKKKKKKKKNTVLAGRQKKMTGTVKRRPNRNRIDKAKNR